ncbi:MAG: CehA/McbA family metallohydrolase [Vicinamibacterales bacterium]
MLVSRLVRLLVVLGLGAAWYSLLPPRSLALPPLPADTPAPIRGAFHVHTVRSDGTGDVDEVAAAAARAGLRFVIFTDHGDGTRVPDAPGYRHGVLCIDGVEVSTTGGHVVALGLSAAPYPLGGKPGDVMEDITRLGGLAFAAHPGSAKRELRWTNWDAPLDGIEWLNADSEWRDETTWPLVRVLLAFPFRAREALASLLDRPDEVLAHWDALTLRRRVSAVAAADAHARIGLTSLGEPYDSGTRLRIPSYETMFRTFSIVLSDQVLTGNATIDAPVVLSALRAGHVHSLVNALAEPAGMRFTATSGDNIAGAGDALALDGPVTLRVETHAPPEALVTIFRDGKAFRIGDGTPLVEVQPAEPAVYRVEVRLPGAPGTPPVPWILSNPIYVGRAVLPGSADVRKDSHKAAEVFAALYDNGPIAPGAIERSEEARGAFDVVPASGGNQLKFRYALGGRASLSPYVAVVVPAGPRIADYDRLVFTARADRRMRLSVQLRLPGGREGERWQRSVYVDETPRSITVYFDEMSPRDSTSRARPVLQGVDSLLFVVDAVNTALGTSGQVWLDGIMYAR